MPTCSKCHEDAVTHIRYSGQHLCRDHFLHFFTRRAKMEVHQQGRLPKGTVAVALSGGKDSVAVLHFLVELTRQRADVDLVAISIDEGIAGYRESALDICRQVTDEWNVPWHVVRTRELAGYDIDEFAAGNAGAGAEGLPRPACGPCGVFRRVGMNKLGRELGAQAMVTGHNLDDQAQTVLMNYLEGDIGRLVRLAPHTTSRPGMVRRILPFRVIPEKEVLLYGLLHGLPIHDEAECPYAERAHRFQMRDVLQGLEERTPGTRHSLVSGHAKIKDRLLADGQHAAPVGSCSRCGEPTSGAICKACAWAP